MRHSNISEPKYYWYLVEGKVIRYNRRPRYLILKQSHKLQYPWSK